MFTHHTILSLRPGRGTAAATPVFGHFRDYHFAHNVMEAKRYLLRCLRHINQSHYPTPDVILVDAGRENGDIKAELEQWMEKHPRLGRVQVKFPEKISWIHRCWKRWSFRPGSSAVTA